MYGAVIITVLFLTFLYVAADNEGKATLKFIQLRKAHKEWVCLCCNVSVSHVLIA